MGLSVCFFLTVSLSYFTVPLILQAFFSLSLFACVLCQIVARLLGGDTAACLLAKLRAEYQCSATVTAGSICPFEMERDSVMGERNGSRGNRGKSSG